MAFGEVRKTPSVFDQPLGSVGQMVVVFGVCALVVGEEQARTLVEALRVVDEPAPQAGEAVGVFGLELGSCPAYESCGRGVRCEV